MFITFLGSCANQTAIREGVAFLVESDSSSLLVDTGPGIVASLQRSHRKASDIDNVFLTHTHGDHILGFAYFVWNRNFERKGRESANDLTVYGNAPSVEAARTMVEMCYPGVKFDFDVNYVVINSDDSFDAGDLSVTAVEAIHPVPTLACIIKCNNKLVSYSADSLPIEKLAKLSQNANLVIHEGMFTNESEAASRKVMHSTAVDAGKFAASVNAMQLLLVHIAPGLFGREVELLREARNVYKGNVSIPCDGSAYIV